jgi:hypothetical protein
MAAPKENKNAEKWDIDAASVFFNNAYKLSKEKKADVYTYDFIGELARELGEYKEIFSYLSNKFPSLNNIHKKIISNCESNCYYNGKKQNIVPSLAIMNLKSNHGWTDRTQTDVTSMGKPIANKMKVEIMDYSEKDDNTSE